MEEEDKCCTFVMNHMYQPGNGVDEYERVSFGDGQSLHSWKLMTPGSVGDLQRANILLVAADYLK